MSDLDKYVEGFYKDIYWKELERRDKIIANLTLLVGAIKWHQMKNLNHLKSLNHQKGQ